MGGDGTYTPLAGDILQGRELHAAIQFNGTFSSISWTAAPAENWHGITVGLQPSVIPLPAAAWLLGLGNAQVDWHGATNSGRLSRHENAPRGAGPEKGESVGVLVDLTGRTTRRFDGFSPLSWLWLSWLAAADTWTAVTLANVPLGRGVAIGDVNGDGRPDVLAGGTWHEQPLDPVTDEWTRHDYAPTRAPGGMIATGDINRDGRTDIVFVDDVPWSVELTWFEAPPDPVNGVWIPHDVAVLELVHSLQLADMDRNGWLDIVTAERAESEKKRVAVYYNGRAGNVWTEQILYTSGSHNLAVGDMEPDGDMDILGANWHPGETDGGAIILWINQHN